VSVKSEFIDTVNDSYEDRVNSVDFRPNVEVWPEWDDDSRWVAEHERKARAVICATPEFADTPFCGRGHH
jgi:hypothetical protein